MTLTFIQTSDPFEYADMLAETSRTVRLYCRKHGHRYENYIGIKRGLHPWQAAFNRIYLLQEMVDRGVDGWVVYIDADAYIIDMDFDLEGYVRSFEGRAFVASPSGASDAAWDVNNGVFFIDLRHPVARRILRRWKAAYESVSDQRIAAAHDWEQDDQAMLHIILQENPELLEQVAKADWQLINSPSATVIRQCLRAMGPDLASRLATVRAEVQAVLDRQG